MLVIGFIGCSEEHESTEALRVTVPSFSNLSMNEDVVFTLTSEMTMSKKVSPIPGNEDCVSEAENQLRFKKSMDCLLFMMIKANGDIDADIQMTDFGNNPIYPANMIGCPKYDAAYLTDKIEVRNGATTIYNKAGEVLNSNSQNEVDTDFFLSIIEAINKKQSTVISSENWEIVETAMSGNGYEIIDRETRRDDLIFAMQRKDGGKTELSINKELGVFTESRHYDSDGNVTSASRTIFSEGVSTKWQDRIRSQVFIVPYKSPFVDCDMALIKAVDYKSFDVNYK